MSPALDSQYRSAAVIEPDPFELDITFVEQSTGAAALLNVTDDGCGTTCPHACGTSYEG